MKSNFITSVLVSAILELSQKTVERKSNSGELPFQVVDTGGGRIIRIFNRDDVLAYKAKREAAKNKEAITIAPLVA